MLKLTLGNSSNVIYINRAHIVALMDATPQGTLVVCTSGTYQVLQTPEQILKQMGDA